MPVEPPEDLGEVMAWLQVLFDLNGYSWQHPRVSAWVKAACTRLGKPPSHHNLSPAYLKQLAAKIAASTPQIPPAIQKRIIREYDPPKPQKQAS